MKSDYMDFEVLVYILVYIFPLFFYKGKIHTQIQLVIGNKNFNYFYNMIAIWIIKA